MSLPVGFHFRVVFPDIDPEEKDTGFLSVTGLEIGFTENRVLRSTPGTRPSNEIDLTVSFPPLTLIRAVRDKNDSPLTDWLFIALKRKKAVPLQEVIIQLLDEQHEPQFTWHLLSVKPRSWKLNELNALQSNVLTETIELEYEAFRFGED